MLPQFASKLYYYLY